MHLHPSPASLTPAGRQPALTRLGPARHRPAWTLSLAHSLAFSQAPNSQRLPPSPLSPPYLFPPHLSLSPPCSRAILPTSLFTYQTPHPQPPSLSLSLSLSPSPSLSLSRPNHAILASGDDWCVFELAGSAVRRFGRNGARLQAPSATLRPGGLPESRLGTGPGCNRCMPTLGRNAVGARWAIQGGRSPPGHNALLRGRLVR